MKHLKTGRSFILEQTKRKNDLTPLLNNAHLPDNCLVDLAELICDLTLTQAKAFYETLKTNRQKKKKNEED